MKTSLILLITTLCLLSTGCTGKYQLRVGWKIPVKKSSKPLSYWELSTLLVPYANDFRNRAVRHESQLLTQYLPLHQYGFDDLTKIRESEWALKEAIKAETKARLLANSLRRRKVTFTDFQNFVAFGQVAQTQSEIAKRSYQHFYKENPRTLKRSDIERSYLKYRWKLIAQYNASLRLAEIESIKTTISELKGKSFSKNTKKLDKIEKEHKKIEKTLREASRQLTKRTILNSNSDSLLKLMIELKKMVMLADTLAEHVAEYRHWARKYDPVLLKQNALLLADKNIQRIYKLNLNTSVHIWSRLKSKTKAWKSRLNIIDKQLVGLSHHHAIRMLSKLKKLELEFNHFRSGEEAVLAYMENTTYEHAVLNNVAEQLIRLYKKLKPFLPRANQKRLPVEFQEPSSIGIQSFTVLIHASEIEDIQLVRSESVIKVPEAKVGLVKASVEKFVVVDDVTESNQLMTKATEVSHTEATEVSLVETKELPANLLNATLVERDMVGVNNLNGDDNFFSLFLAMFAGLFVICLVGNKYHGDEGGFLGTIP